MPRNQTAVRLLITLFILLPFTVVAQVTLAAAAVVFFLQPFELSRIYALIAVSVVQMLARLHRWMEAQRIEEEEGNLAPALLPSPANCVPPGAPHLGSSGAPREHLGRTSGAPREHLGGTITGGGALVRQRGAPEVPSR